MKFTHYRKLIYLQRLNTGVRLIKPYSLIEHSYLTGILFEKLCKLSDTPFSKEALLVVFKHDLIEVFTGDCPNPIKHISSETSLSWKLLEVNACEKYDLLDDDDIKLDVDIEDFLDKENPHLYTIFKIADILELYYFCKNEQEMGNSDRQVKYIMECCEADIRGLLNEFPSIRLIDILEFLEKSR